MYTKIYYSPPNLFSGQMFSFAIKTLKISDQHVKVNVCCDPNYSRHKATMARLSNLFSIKVDIVGIYNLWKPIPLPENDILAAR